MLRTEALPCSSIASSLAAIGVVSLLAAGCAAATPAEAVVPRVAYEREGQSKAGTAATSSRPLVIEWPAAERARLESSSKRGMVVVHYDDSTMEVLSRCAAPGTYTYTATTPQREGVHIRDEDELRANLPLGAASLASRLARSGELTVELSVVGTYDSSEKIPSRADLVGDCAGATHVVVALTTGAFQFYSGGAADAGASVDALGAGAGGRSSARRELISEAGDPAACKTSGAADVAPPFGCGALLRVEVERLATHAAVAPVVPDPVAPTEPVAPGSSEPAPAEPSEPAQPVPPPPRAQAPVEPAPPMDRAPPQDPGPSPEPAPASSENSPLTTVGIVVGVIVVVGFLVVLPVVAAVTEPPVEPKEPAPAGLGKAGVSAPFPGVSGWRF